MNIRILITILHDLIFFGVSFFVSLWIRLDLNSALILCKELWWFLIFFSFTNIFLLKYMGLYHGIWRYASIHEIKSIIKSVSVSILLLLGIFFLYLDWKIYLGPFQFYYSLSQFLALLVQEFSIGF